MRRVRTERGILRCRPVEQHTASTPVCCGVKARGILVGTFKAVCGEQCIDELRAACLYAVVVDAQTLESMRAGVRDKDIGGLEKLEQGFLAVGILEVEAQTALAAVVSLENGGVIFGRRHLPCTADGAVGLALCRLDLNDIGTPLGHDAACHGRCDMSSELNDFDVFQRLHSIRSFLH